MPWGIGIMEYWNTGFGGLRSFFIDGMDQKIESDHDPLLNPTIPFFHHSIIPWVI
jgi:hypothetical protein